MIFVCLLFQLVRVLDEMYFFVSQQTRNSRTFLQLTILISQLKRQTYYDRCRSAQQIDITVKAGKREAQIGHGEYVTIVPIKCIFLPGIRFLLGIIIKPLFVVSTIRDQAEVTKTTSTGSLPSERTSNRAGGQQLHLPYAPFKVGIFLGRVFPSFNGAYGRTDPQQPEPPTLSLQERTPIGMLDTKKLLPG